MQMKRALLYFHLYSYQSEFTELRWKKKDSETLKY